MKSWKYSQNPYNVEWVTLRVASDIAFNIANIFNFDTPANWEPENYPGYGYEFY